MDWLWLVGIWQRSPAAAELARTGIAGQEQAGGVLSSLTHHDIIGSPFAIKDYTVDTEIGTDASLGHFRERLRKHEIRLMLDFVPNHTARDHAWVTGHPEFFMQGTEAEIGQHPEAYVRLQSPGGSIIFAHGREPHAAPWSDTLQLDFSQLPAQAAVIQELIRVAHLCDGVRCNMAMLVLPAVFQRTWSVRPEPFWPVAIQRVRQQWPDFTFLAESYWDLQFALQQHGFDYTYDKSLYDALLSLSSGAVRERLGAPLGNQRKLVHFLENESSERAAAVFPPGVHQAAAVLAYTAPGMRLFHRGQFEGRKTRKPVGLARVPEEPPNLELREFYERLAQCTQHPAIREGTWQLMRCDPAWSGNSTCDGFIAFYRRSLKSPHLLVTVNYAPSQGQCYVPLPIKDLYGQKFVLTDLLSDARYPREGDELTNKGLYLDVPAWGHHVFEFQPSGPPERAIVPLIEPSRVLSGHQGWINRIAWSSDGGLLASCSNDKSVRIWDAETGHELHAISSYADKVVCVAWMPNSRVLASGSADGVVKIWDVSTMRRRAIFEAHAGSVHALAWSPDGKLLATGGADWRVHIWDAETAMRVRALDGHRAAIFSLAWSNRGMLASGAADHSVRLWDGGMARGVRELRGHVGTVLCLAWHPDDRTLASGATDSSIRIWDAAQGRNTDVLEVHSGDVRSLGFSPEGTLMASKAADNTIRLWRCRTWEVLQVLPELHAGAWLAGLDFHPHLPILAAVGDQDLVIQTWKFDIRSLLETAPPTASVRRATAKIVLVGESGVGKSGLGYRLAQGHFEPQESTHGQHFWILDVPSLRTELQDGTECDVVLWDLAGQSDYRVIHALFLDDADVALILFNPADPREPLREVDYWLKTLARRPTGPCRCILVGARIDVGHPTITPEEIDTFCHARNVSGGYVATSAKTGQGIETLLGRIQAQIGWEQMKVTTTTTAFDDIQRFILELKAGENRNLVLIGAETLQEQMQIRRTGWSFSTDDTIAAVRHLAKHGYATILQTPSANKIVLLAPELLNNLAASFVLEARRNPRGLGALDEVKLRLGDYEFRELRGLSAEQQALLLNAATVLFLEHNVCFRETIGRATFLVFPELINQKNPLPDDGLELEEDMSYLASGAVQNLYPALVVLLGYTNVFSRTTQWQSQAQYEVTPSEICGFRKLEERDGEVSFVLYYAVTVSPMTRMLFQGLFERILAGREITVTRYRPQVCDKCGHMQARETVVGLTKEGVQHLFCSRCGQQLVLRRPEGPDTLTPELSRQVDQERTIAAMRTRLEAALVRLKGRRHEKQSPISCFLSYAHHNDSDYQRRFDTFVSHISNAGIELILDRSHAPLSMDLHRFADRISTVDIVLVLGTKLYLQKYNRERSYVAIEMHQIQLRDQRSVLPVLFEGSEHESFPPSLRGRVYSDLRDENAYFANIFDLILHMQGIRVDDPSVKDLREALAGPS